MENLEGVRKDFGRIWEGVGKDGGVIWESVWEHSGGVGRFYKELGKMLEGVRKDF